MLTDAKFSSIQRNGFETIAKVKFYEGDVTTEDELTKNGLEPVTRYRRTAKVSEKEFRFPGSVDESVILDAVKDEIKKDKARSPIIQWRQP